jgi:hypothetical protein
VSSPKPLNASCWAAETKIKTDNPQIPESEIERVFDTSEPPSSFKIIKSGFKILEGPVNVDKLNKIQTQAHKLAVTCARGILAVNRNFSPSEFDKKTCEGIGNSPNDANGLNQFCKDVADAYGKSTQMTIKRGPDLAKVPELATLITDSNPDNLLLNLLNHPSSLVWARESLGVSYEKSALQREKLASLNDSMAFRCLTVEAQVEVKCRAQFIFGKEAAEFGLVANNLYNLNPGKADPKLVIETVFANIGPIARFFNISFPPPKNDVPPKP